MPYDLEIVHELCEVLGLSSHLDAQSVDIDLGDGAVLRFQNAAADDDCLIGFVGTGWHVHDDIIFADGAGNYVKLDYLGVLTGLAEGHVLVCERRLGGPLLDRWLTHDLYNNELEYLKEGEELTIRRVRTRKAASAEA